MLREVVSSRRPELEGSLGKLGEAPLSEEEREELRELLADELCDHGLRPDGEPNARGKKADDIIGKLWNY